MSPQMQSRIYALREHVSSHVKLLKEEVDLALRNPIFVSGHDGYFKEVEDKLAAIAEYKGILDVLKEEFDEGSRD